METRVYDWIEGREIMEPTSIKAFMEDPYALRPSVDFKDTKEHLGGALKDPACETDLNTKL